MLPELSRKNSYTFSYGASMPKLGEQDTLDNWIKLIGSSCRRKSS